MPKGIWSLNYKTFSQEKVWINLSFTFLLFFSSERFGVSFPKPWGEVQNSILVSTEISHSIFFFLHGREETQTWELLCHSWQYLFNYWVFWILLFDHQISQLLLSTFSVFLWYHTLEIMTQNSFSTTLNLISSMLSILPHLYRKVALQPNPIIFQGIEYIFRISPFWIVILIRR